VGDACHLKAAYARRSIYEQDQPHMPRRMPRQMETQTPYWYTSLTTTTAAATTNATIITNAYKPCCILPILLTGDQPLATGTQRPRQPPLTNDSYYQRPATATTTAIANSTTTTPTTAATTAVTTTTTNGTATTTTTTPPPLLLPQRRQSTLQNYCNLQLEPPLLH
jgi:hypothetical protein